MMTDPQDKAMPICPVCGEEAETFVINYLGQIVGCDNCTRQVSIYDMEEKIDI